MCETCGCGNPGQKAIIRIPGEDPADPHKNLQKHDYYQSHGHSHADGHDHHHTHPHHEGSDHSHEHEHIGNARQIVPVETDILHANNLLAERNRGMFEAKNITAINLMSSPGSGKTTLLERTINDLKGKIKFSVIEGDQQTMYDAERIKLTGVPVVQVNTGNGCHLGP